MGAPENQPLYNDQDLLKFLWKDDRRGMEILFRLYYQRLYHFVFLITEDQLMAEDVVQEVFINLWRVRHNLQGTTTFKPYLFRACKNLAFNKIKASRRLKFTTEEKAELPANTTSITDLMEHRQLSEYIDQAIRALPPKRQLIFQLSRFDQLSYVEIAEYLDISVKTVENQMSAALRTLRKEIENYLSED